LGLEEGRRTPGDALHERKKAVLERFLEGRSFQDVNDRREKFNRTQGV